MSTIWKHPICENEVNVVQDIAKFLINVLERLHESRTHVQTRQTRQQKQLCNPIQFPSEISSLKKIQEPDMSDMCSNLNVT